MRWCCWRSFPSDPANRRSANRIVVTRRGAFVCLFLAFHSLARALLDFARVEASSARLQMVHSWLDFDNIMSRSTQRSFGTRGSDRWHEQNEQNESIGSSHEARGVQAFVLVAPFIINLFTSAAINRAERSHKARQATSCHHGSPTSSLAPSTSSAAPSSSSALPSALPTPTSIIRGDFEGSPSDWTIRLHLTMASSTTSRTRTPTVACTQAPYTIPRELQTRLGSTSISPLRPTPSTSSASGSRRPEPTPAALSALTSATPPSGPTSFKVSPPTSPPHWIQLGSVLQPAGRMMKRRTVTSP
ncbi:hypothetical protein B0T16DRAFT_419855 [Cercophora newfieldiana]|uniref:Uncharacterized protein n=1 Tax=Cercophora newfieldiana TaxID=92897 RepID=A0AA39XXM6_9PEZI|nr:hypothetical protein B0T16DRAFT_419855 [Cercophora newfieldiana]